MKRSQRRIWTTEEQAILRQLFPHYYTADICQKLHRSYSSVVGHAAKLGLKKNERFKLQQQQASGRQCAANGYGVRFKAGHVPANKGKRMSAEQYQVCAHTMFKKGHVPRNVKYNGHERTDADGYRWRRISTGNYVQLHRWLWEQAHGAIPAGHIVKFIDGNKANVVLQNLKLVSCKQNMLDNTIAHYPIELKQSIILVNKINNTIKKRHAK
jgi:hypothetical protein